MSYGEELKNVMEKIKVWFEGYKEGEKSVIQFLKEMKGLDFQEEFKSWSNADEYTKLNGEVVKRYA